MIQNRSTRSIFVVAGFALITWAHGAHAAPVTFEAPDNLEVGAAPLPATSTFGMVWDFEGNGVQSLNILTSVQAPYQLVNSIVPRPNGHAINTKGAGANDRLLGLGFTPANPSRRVREAAARMSSQNNLRQISLAITMEGDNDSPLNNNLLLYEIVISSPAGMVFSSDPTFEIFSDFSGMVIDTNLVAPAGGFVDPNLPDATFQLSAVAVPVPEPTAASLLLLASASLLKRRRD